MTVSTIKADEAFIGNGATTTFPCSIKVFDAGHVEVRVNGVLQTQGTHYTVGGVGGATTDVVFVTPPANQAKVSVFRRISFTQETDYLANDPFPAETHERALDLLTMGLQQHQRNFQRSLHAAPEDPAELDMVLPPVEERDGKLLTFDSEGKPVASTGTSFGVLSTGVENIWTAPQNLRVAPGNDGWRLQDSAGQTAIKMRIHPDGAGRLVVNNALGEERVTIDGDVDPPVRVATDADKGGVEVFLWEGSFPGVVRAKIGLSPTKEGRLELYDNAPEVKFYADPSADPAVVIEVPNDTDGFVVRNTDNESLVKMRSSAAGHGSLVVFDNNGSFGSVIAGSGSPEGLRPAEVGTMYLRSDGGVGTTLYVKESGTGNTGWVAK